MTSGLVRYRTPGDDPAMAHAVAECLQLLCVDARVSREGGTLEVECPHREQAYAALQGAVSHLASLFGPGRLVVHNEGATLLRTFPEEPPSVTEAAAALLRRALLDHVECFAADPREELASEVGLRVSLLPLSGCDDATPPLELDVTNREAAPRCITSEHLRLPEGVEVVGGSRYPLAMLGPGESLSLTFPVERGVGHRDARFRSVARVSVREDPRGGGHTVHLERLIGQLTGEECLEAAVDYIRRHARLCVDLEADRPHCLTSEVQSPRCFVYRAAEETPPRLVVPSTDNTIAAEASAELHRLRVAYGEAMAETNRAHLIRDSVNPLDALDDRVKRDWGFVSRAAPKLIQIATERGLLRRERPAWRIASLCEGPGSFPQWLLYQTRHHPDVTLFGFTLQGSREEEFRLGSVRGAELPLHRFLDMSGPGGDITKPWEVEALVRRVRDHPSLGCAERGVHLVTADGGLQDNRLNQEEANTLALIAGELAAGLALLEAGGDMVLKLFLIETPPMARLLHQASEFFETVELVKPLASRGTNSEKYMVASGFRNLLGGRRWAKGIWDALAESPPQVAAHLAGREAVPRPFLRFLRRANTGMATHQAASLRAVLDLPPSGRARRVQHGQRSRALSETCLWQWGLVDALSA